MTLHRGFALFVLAMAAPGLAWAHAADRGLVMLLPTGYYLAGGAASVAVSFAVLSIAPGRWLNGLFGASLNIPLPVLRLRPWTSWVGFCAFLFLVAAGFLGTRDPLANPLPLIIWTLWWVGFTLLVALLGNLWSAINPWSGPVELARRLLGTSDRQLPVWLRDWPALLGLAAVAWFELVDVAPNDPERLAWVVVVYWTAHFTAMLIWGDEWRERCETFSVFFALIARVAPIRIEDDRTGCRLRVTLPGARLVERRPLGSIETIFVTLLIATVSFDGLAGTFVWLELIGVNPLEFPGRSAVQAENTLGLMKMALVMGSLFVLSVNAGRIFAGSPASRGLMLGRLALSLLPIALAYHFAHYLTVLLVNGQYAFLALSDPFATGADWLGVGERHVTTSFLNNLESVEVIWQIQSAAIVAGHLLAVLVAHAIALDIEGEPRRATIGQIPLAALMVGYTAFGLWLLSTPTGA